MGRLVLLFIAIPAIELMLLIEIGSRVGTLATFSLIVATGLLGATLARAQGVSVIAQLQSELAAGRLPTTTLVDGAIVLVSAALLLTPGLLTDLVGFLGLVPPVRAALRRWLWRRFQIQVERQQIRVETFGGPAEPPAYDADYRSLD